jgi:hypothetical protein
MPTTKSSRPGDPTPRAEADVATTIRLPKTWHRALKVKAAEEDSTMADLIRAAVGEKYGLREGGRFNGRPAAP